MRLWGTDRETSRESREQQKGNRDENRMFGEMGKGETRMGERERMEKW